MREKKNWLFRLNKVIVLQSETSLDRWPIRKSFETVKLLSGTDEEKPDKVESFWHCNTQPSHDREPVSASQNVGLDRIAAFVCVSN